jgi:hypothetical protein
MRRSLSLIAILAVAAAAWALPGAGAEQTIEAAPLIDRQAQAVCPYVVATDTVDTIISVLAPGTRKAEISWPVVGDVAATTKTRLVAGGGLANPADVPLSGVVSAIVEVPGEAAAVSVVPRGEGSVAADTCPVSLPDVWYLPGGSTEPGQTLELHLANPFPSDAVVSVRASSNLGVEADAALETFAVPARSTRTVDLSSTFEFRDSLSVVVQPVEGHVIPAMTQFGEGDFAVWSGTAGSRTIELPVTRTEEGQHAWLVLVTDSPTPVGYTVDIATGGGGTPSVLEGEIGASSQVRIPFRRIFSQSEMFGIRVTATAEIGAAVVLSDPEGGQSVATGTSVLGSTWLLPGIPQTRATRQVWFMNTGPDEIEVMFRALGGGDATGSFRVAPGSRRVIELRRLTGRGLLVEATGPVSVGWSVVGEDALAATNGLPIDG